MTISANYPAIRPSLLLDFSNTKQLDPRITFSRPTTATYYDGKTVAKAEENLWLQSQLFSNASWSKFALTLTDNATTAPDGTSTATSFVPTASSTYHYMYQDTYVRSSTVTVSFYAKSNGYNYATITDASVSNLRAVFDLSLVTATLTGTNANLTLTNPTITSVGNGWYRCSVTYNCTNATPAIIPLPTSTTSPAGTWAGDGTSGIYIWGAQLEQRSSVTAYTPTTTAPITNYIPALQTAAANVARFEHDPVTGESKGFLIEEQRTNLVTYSEQFDSWSKYGATVTENIVVSPSGTLKGNKLIENTGTGLHSIYKILTLSNTVYTLSFYMKAGERTIGGIYTNNPGDSFTYFNLSTGTVGTVGHTSATIQAVGNGWYRCSVVFTPTAANCNISPFSAATDGSYSYTGDGFSGLYIWGAQLEAGSFPTSYIPTVASQVTRSADSASMTGSNFSSWYRADEGTLYSEASCQRVNGSTGPLFLSSGTANNIGQYSADQFHLYVRKNNILQVNLDGGTYVAGQFIKNAGAYKVNDFAVSLNGGLATASSNGGLPEVSALYIGTGDQGTAPIGGTIKRIAYYPKRLSNTELQAITS